MRFGSAIPWAAALAVLLAACAPRTDRDRYEVGEPGVVTLRNQLDATLYLAGCNHFDYQKRVGAEWVSQGGDLACVWEGFAEPLPPGAAAADPIRAREPGIWRLRYEVGGGCSETAPLERGACEALGETVSNEFEVVASSCRVGGCSGEICAEEPLASPCIWRPESACYRAASCGRFGASGACGWEPTPELLACLSQFGVAPGAATPEAPR